MNSSSPDCGCDGDCLDHHHHHHHHRPGRPSDPPMSWSKEQPYVHGLGTTPNMSTEDVNHTSHGGHPVPPRMPASPASSLSAIAVGTSSDVALLNSIERGDYAEDSEDTRSLTDSIRQHIIDGGLRYHAYHAGKYLFPNDEAEQDREDLKHSLTILLCEGNYFYAPIHDVLKSGAEVLDLGTGTGKWCIELADQFPETTFHGMDLSPIQPDWVPENAIFVVDDIEHDAGWTYPENHFDLIHIRHTVPSIKDRPELWKRIFKHLKPGGYVEVQDINYIIGCDDESCNAPYAWRDFLGYLEDAMIAMGGDLQSVRKVESQLTETGFEGIGCKTIKLPISPWPKKQRLQEVGFCMRDVIMCGLVGLAKRPFRDGLGWTPIQIEMFLIEVRKSMTAEVNGVPKFHAYFPFHSIYARKPLQ